MNNCKEKITNFLNIQIETSNPLICITSGGTMVPLEKNMIRYIDNFSQGERGALSVEYILALNYAVIFIYRSGTIVPFTRFIRENISRRIDDQFLQKLSIQDSKLIVDVDQASLNDVQNDVEAFHYYTNNSRLLCVPYETLEDYLDLLEFTSKNMAAFESRACLFLAAAVSDFYIPKDQMSEHKLQSSYGLTLELTQVPKMLGVLTKEWAPKVFVVSFKLETDEDILIIKARNAIKSYHVHLVVANMLHTRRDICYLVSPLSPDPEELQTLSPGTMTAQWKDYTTEMIQRNMQQPESRIEKDLVASVVNRHKLFHDMQKDSLTQPVNFFKKFECVSQEEVESKTKFNDVANWFIATTIVVTLGALIYVKSRNNS